MNSANAIPDSAINAKDRADLMRNALQYQADNLTKLWTAIIGSLTGIAAVAAGVIAWRNLRATQAKLDVDRDGQITNRFTQAVAQLGAELKDGKPNLEVRLGGIYALERIARDSPPDHWTIMEVLTAYVRQNARWVPLATPAARTEANDDRRDTHFRARIRHVLRPRQKLVGERALDKQQSRTETPFQLRADVQAILTVLSRRIQSTDRVEPGRLDLSGVDLRSLWRAIDFRLDGVNLSLAHFENTNLESAHLEGADVSNAHFEGARLYNANLKGADLRFAHLQEATFDYAHLEGAELESANLTGTSFAHAHMQGAKFGNAHFEKTGFWGTDLTRADLRFVKTERAFFPDARLEGAHLPQGQSSSDLPRWSRKRTFSS